MALFFKTLGKLRTKEGMQMLQEPVEIMLL